jgi:hypothetical protein
MSFSRKGHYELIIEQEKVLAAEKERQKFNKKLPYHRDEFIFIKA